MSSTVVGLASFVIVAAAAPAAAPALSTPPAATTVAAPSVDPPWRAIALGAQGGLVDGDLTAFLLERHGKKALLLDAGTVIGGIEAARRKGAFPDIDRSVSDDAAAGIVLKERTGAVLISHPHFDHVAGLILATPDDVKRPLLALSPTIDALRDNVFNGTMWANFGSEGKAPIIGRLAYTRMEAGKPVHLEASGVDVTALPLAHAGGVSTAFEIDDGQTSVVYCGDTGPDDVENSDKLARLTTLLAPLVRGHRLAALFIETSYPSSRPDAQLFGHLTPKHLFVLLHSLARAVDLDHPQRALAGLQIVVTHVKPSLDVPAPGGKSPREVIRAELDAQNDLGVRFLLPAQGDVLTLGVP